MNQIRIYKIVVVAVLLGAASVSLGAGGTWTAKAPMPTARTMFSASAVDGKIYAIGGSRTSGSSTSSAVEQYDPVTDTWTTKAPMPTARQWLSTSTVNGKIYAFGGVPRTYQPALSTVEEYDPATDTWTEKAPMPTARTVISTSVADGKIYAIGGFVRPGVWTQEKVTSVVEAYDPATDTWTTKAPMPTARGFLATGVVNGKIYAIGGATYAGGGTLSTVEEYDPATDTWTTKAPMPMARTTFLAASTVNGIIYVIGGARGGSTLSTVEAYDPATDTWTTKAPMPTARAFLATSAVNGKIYAIGGTLGAPWSGISTVEEYEVIFIPADFNRDRIVDIKDLLILIENWGQNEPLADIVPLPFGDGIVDALELEMLMSYWGQKVEDITAHWALDETGGVVAHDCIGNNDGTLHGEPLWQPIGGKFAGTLEFDGIDDYVSTDFVLDPAKSSFSVFAWVKGGAPGQVIISQADTTIDNPLGQSTNPRITWLGANLSDGRLMTGLMDTFFGTLESESVITDGQWHHVGLIYDLIGLRRYLYVDGAEVAKDTNNVGGVGSDGDLYFGTGKDMETGTYFSGLIDDVRIYHRNLSAEEIEAMAQ
ncbi:MAG: Kelch repeat-containing protein [Planctomycetota bacterium]|jgi:N-acetylneuraminic acid mutarotase